MPFAHRALRRFALPWLLLALQATAASAATLAGGPMAGPATAERIGVWLMTDAPAQVQLEYWPHAQPGAVRRSAPVAASYRNRSVKVPPTSTPTIGRLIATPSHPRQSSRHSPEQLPPH